MSGSLFNDGRTTGGSRSRRYGRGWHRSTIIFEMILESVRALLDVLMRVGRRRRNAVAEDV